MWVARRDYEASEHGLTVVRHGIATAFLRSRLAMTVAVLRSRLAMTIGVLGAGSIDKWVHSARPRHDGSGAIEHQTADQSPRLR
jgi:hypothetical protein